LFLKILNKITEVRRISDDIENNRSLILNFFDDGPYFAWNLRKHLECHLDIC